MDHKKMDCEYGRWIELAENHVILLTLVLELLNLRVLVPESSFFSQGHHSVFQKQIGPRYPMPW
jgi:hypothetical protein